MNKDVYIKSRQRYWDSPGGSTLQWGEGRNLLSRATLICCDCAETITDEPCDDAEMLSEEDFERQSIYHVPDKPCPPYTFDRIRKTLPSNLALLPSASESNVSWLLFSQPSLPIACKWFN